MEEINNFANIAQTVDSWCKSLLEENKAALRSIVSPYGFRDEEIVYQDDKLMHKEDIQYHQDEYIDHICSLWDKREYV